MLINLKESLAYGAEKKIAIGSFNVYNVESVQAVLEATKDTNHMVIISFGEKYDSHMPIEAMAALVRSYCETSLQPVVLHLDHSKDLTNILRAMRAGFTSIMYDGSSKPVAENIAATKEIVRIAHALDVSVEGELGYLNEEDGTGSIGNADTYTRVTDAKAFAAETGADALAIAIGNAHGIYKGIPKLDFVRLQEIAEAVAIPLVLHGSSGIPKEAIQKAIQLGIRKININTEVSTTGIRAARAFLASHTDANTRFETMTKAAETAMCEIVREYVSWFDRADESQIG